jgi:predicted O-linked N-acetylglucosamine transferase (SPINDLY family)
LAHLLRRAGRLTESLQCFAQARRAAPRSAQANGNLAMICLDLDRYEEAARYAQAAAQIEPGRAQWWVALGVAERFLKHVDISVDALRRAVKLDPGGNYAKAELALVLLEAGDIEGSRQLLTSLDAGAHDERFRWAYELSLPSVYRDEREIEAERQRFERGLGNVADSLKLDTASQRQGALEAASSVSITLLHYQDRDNTELQCRFGDLITRVMSSAAPACMRSCDWRPLDHGGRLRVGIVSSHLMHHSISRYYTTLLTSLASDKFDVRVWYLGVSRDFNTEFIATRVSSFVHVKTDLLETAEDIRANRLDALVYVETGTDPRHQVLASLRLAPVQCVLAGHPVTSGLPNCDFYLSGAALEPPDAQQHYRERLVRLPGIGACPQKPPAPGDGSWFDAHQHDRPLILCLQNHVKLLPAFDATLAKIVHRTNARIGFFIRNAMVGQRFRDRIERCFEGHGLDSRDHLVFLPEMSHEKYLAGIARSPLVIDSPWFSGGATSLDALSAGTPVLAWEGRMARGRQTSGMLRVLGIHELIAQNEEEYIDKVATLLADTQQLGALRRRIDETKSRLFESGPLVLAFEQFLLSTSAR